MKHISYDKANNLVCSHPDVLRIKKFGSMSNYPESKLYNNVSVKLKSGDSITFTDNGDGSSVIKADEYIQNLK